jgi:hypothetical protein
VTAAVNDHFAIPVASTQVFIIDSLEPFLPNDVAGFVALLLKGRFLELLRADFAHVAERMGQLAVVRVTPLRGLLDAQRRKFELMGIDPGNVGRRSAFFDENGFESRLGPDLIEALAQECFVNHQPFCEGLNQRIIDAFCDFPREDNAVNRPRINQYFAIAIENHPAWRRDRQQANALIFGHLSVALAVDYLELVKAQAKDTEQDQNKRLNQAKANAQVLRIIDELHIEWLARCY